MICLIKGREKIILRRIGRAVKREKELMLMLVRNPLAHNHHQGNRNNRLLLT
jgi:hypothetical protein